MTTLAPDRAGPAAGPTAGPAAGLAAGPQTPGRVKDAAVGAPRSAGWQPNDSGTRAWLRRKAVAAWMNVLIAATVAITVLTAGVTAGRTWPAPGTWGISALKLFALWCLAFLPGWLYVRFLDLRAKALWSEYVLNLHRLGWDLPWHLPAPPVASGFYREWENGPHGRPADNIYRQKFEAYYGRQITSSAPDENYSVRSESLFPVFLATAVLAVGWAAVLWDTRFVTHPSGPWDVLKYGFLGAYAFVTSMLIRRFFQSDLRPSAYATAVYRIVLVLLIVTVLHQVLGGTTAVTERAELAVAFVVGFFPLVGLQALQRVTSRALRWFVPPVTSEYPLDQLDGFNLWYEARLTEEGVEDMQNLTTMNLVDVILHTRVPAGRGGLDRPGLPADPPGAGEPRRAEPAPPGRRAGPGAGRELAAERRTGGCLQRGGQGMKPLVRRTYPAYAAPLDRAMCFSSSRLPVCLTSMFVIYTGQATSTTPSQWEHASSHRPNHTMASPK